LPEPRYATGPGDLPGRETLLAMSGLAFMEAMRDGAIPGSPMAGLFGFRIHEVAPGRVTFRARPEAGHLNPMGTLHGGWYGALLDTVMGCAVMTVVPRGQWYTTLEYRVNLTRAIPPGTEVEAEGLVEHAGRSTAVARGTIRGLIDGRLHATGSTTCLILAG
jgi:uncharacterized protein (TIGR00369 family)